MMDPIRARVTPGVPAVETRPGLGALAVALSDAAQALEPPGPAIGPAAAVVAARAEAAGRQAALGPILANLEQALGATSLPPNVKVAIGQVLALQTPTSAPMTPEILKQAVAQSGLFLEAKLAAGDAPPMDLKAALLVLQQALGPTGQRGASRPQRPTPPPTAGGALVGQAPAKATLSLDADPVALAHELGSEVEQALARHTLHQLASLPDGPGAHWMFELPLATPQGPAIAQFAIDRDDPQRAGEDQAPTWQARFSLDIPPLGPVHVSVRMDGEQTAVTMWAEQPEGLARLRSRGDELSGALAAEVVFRPGSPHPPAPPPGRLVDQTS
ncbi:MAG: flagellar hook-length control protein FliK [Alphaproteobacteria bacterium]|nr:flagellar hook-length control protein FliK [Alphaproteobacteria bacterium]MBU1514620.1 flagellar hook-length control protein FliK [Alphaproteobacteria bacterium]MBU2096748.1 flagellar hook-length control protein FliK [Alphaproteobacteria bacterium]MBU2150380.1 flagellar hook-length control protein FliK [Alphaproteobacteria bacterium]MBU2306619.1 flagellar hook-length control protein FliK [Alphaproteobacteria bacterium]